MARKILLADDSVTAQNMGRKILADAGYEVIAVNNGSAALKKITEVKPDLVILDVYMPGYSGLEVCQRLKEAPETSRIPVLLTVGKLEPFKPEEAQRVRAEGYIVKPFEASELLSALSKLEDKIVPRAEPSKPGRFARAIAAAEETDRNGKKEPSSNETGWKNRIAFPSKNTETDDAAGEPQSANGAENSGGNKEREREREREEDKRYDSSRAEVHVDVAAFAPIGVPKDVTPAEVAAITAAAAQMQVAEASSRKESRNSESAASPAASEFAVEPSGETFHDSRDEIQPNASRELSAARSVSPNGDEKVKDEKLDDSPVTMAASSESDSAGTPRWTAVPVALESDETSISLDREMQKAYAAFATADYATSAGTVEAEASSRDISPAPPEAITEAHSSGLAATPAEEPVVAIPTSEPAAAPESEPAPAETNIETAPTPDLATPDVSTPDVSTPDSPSPNENSVPSVELASPQVATVVDSAAAIETVAAAEPSTAEPATATSDSPAATESSASKPDSETVKTTAAAWANWRQTHDTEAGNGQQPEANIQDSAMPEASTTDSAALAAAAGAENALQDVSTAPPSGNPSDVASIVDSVLAGLRPKLMEEITRKMAEKK